MAFAQIIVKLTAHAADSIYTYRVPEGMNVPVGSMVRVPFGKGDRMLDGFVLGLSETADGSIGRIKLIASVSGREPVFTGRELGMAEWMSRRYDAPLSSCLALFVPRDPDRTTQVRVYARLLREPLPADRAGSVQKSFLSVLAEHPDWSLSLLMKASGAVRSSVRSLENKGIIECFEESDETPAPLVMQKATDPGKELNAEQRQAADRIIRAFREGQNSKFLLYGITGSGKTEVYMSCMEQVLAAGKGAYLLVPEISLTPQLVERLGRRFGDRIAVLHSRLNDTERSREWLRIRRGAAKVVVGPRSALFAPMPDPGLIILDEEHESSYKSEITPRYHAREVAEEMAARGGFPLVLGSATPSCESYYQAMEGQAELLRLSRRAVQDAVLPAIRLIDMRREMAAGNMTGFSGELIAALKDRLARNEQSILFLNRRGYSSFVSCRKCGFVLRCPACFLPYTYHKEQNLLICHHCGRAVQPVNTCPSCGSRYLRMSGMGTERIAEDLAGLFPDARILRMDASTTSGKNGFQEAYEQIRDHKADIIVGTQMIAKGMDMPLVTLVGVISADMSLYYPDFHSTERTFQLLTQVAGRAGRGDRPGEVLIQTYEPKHYVLQSVAAHDDAEFYRQELASRQMLACPPFAHFLQILLTGREEDKVRQAAGDLAGILQRESETAESGEAVVLGPSPAELGRIDNIFRWKLLVRHPEEEPLIRMAGVCLEEFRQKYRDVAAAADLNPVNMY